MDDEGFVSGSDAESDAGVDAEFDEEKLGSMLEKALTRRKLRAMLHLLTATLTSDPYPALRMQKKTKKSTALTKRRLPFGGKMILRAGL